MVCWPLEMNGMPRILPLESQAYVVRQWPTYILVWSGGFPCHRVVFFLIKKKGWYFFSSCSYLPKKLIILTEFWWSFFKTTRMLNFVGKNKNAGKTRKKSSFCSITSVHICKLKSCKQGAVHVSQISLVEFQEQKCAIGTKISLRYLSKLKTYKWQRLQIKNQ